MEEKNIFDKIMELKPFRRFLPFYKKYKEGILYIFFGGCTTVVSIVFFYLFYNVMKIPTLIANILDWIVAVLFAYVVNRKYVFESKDKEIFKELMKFCSGRLVTLGLEEILLFIFVDKLKFNAMLIKISVMVVVMIGNYVISKIFVFIKKDENNG